MCFVLFVIKINVKKDRMYNSIAESIESRDLKHKALL